MQPAREPTDILFQSTKTYAHNVGLSCCFRQHRAKSHCSKLHGYALAVKLTFAALKQYEEHTQDMPEGGPETLTYTEKVSDGLDENNWVVDFGGLKDIKWWLEKTFDHKTLVAKDDPEYSFFQDLHRRKIIDMVDVESTGCEKFAEMIYRYVEGWVVAHHSGRVVLLAVEVREHEANSAIVHNAAYRM